MPTTDYSGERLLAPTGPVRQAGNVNYLLSTALLASNKQLQHSRCTQTHQPENHDIDLTWGL